ncbi:MAG TPA: hypothetical protein VNO55_24255 [Polyangia bacterium]|nr:hypothetical protein [Polyangia bacterium]
MTRLVRTGILLSGLLALGCVTPRATLPDGGGAGGKGSGGSGGSGGKGGSGGGGGQGPNTDAPISPDAIQNSDGQSDAADAPVPPATVTVTLQRNGNGTISGAGISCSNDSCPITVNAGTNLELQANPGADSNFVSWSGCTATNGSTCTLSAINAPVTVNATFALKNAGFSIAKTGNGSGTVTATWAGGSLNCGNSCSAAIQPGTLVTLSAAPANGSTVAWGAPCSGSGGCQVTVAAGGTTLTATFTLKKVSVSVVLSGPPNTGSVVSGAAGINCGNTCSALVDYGTVVPLTATPLTFGVFQKWTGCPSAAANVCTVTANADVSVTAVFLTKNGGGCGGTTECASGFCSGGHCCDAACDTACDLSCTTGTCQHQPVRTSCGSIAGPAGVGTGSEINKICDASGKCVVPTVACPVGGGFAQCNLSSSACCYRNSDRDETCTTDTTNCTFFGQSCYATADCPTGLYCCHTSLPSGFFWAVCMAAGSCNEQQYCDPAAAMPGCLKGSCGTNHICL